jgi:hypothetical protein
LEGGFKKLPTTPNYKSRRADKAPPARRKPADGEQEKKALRPDLLLVITPTTAIKV